MKNLFFLCLFCSAFVLSCKKEKPVVECPDAPTSLEVYLQPRLDGTNYSLNDKIESPQGYTYYFTDIILVGTNAGNGNTDFAPDFMFNYNETASLLVRGAGEVSAFNNLKFNIGVPPALNHADPSLPANTSALNTMNIGSMHWGWNPGYKFVSLEGKVDTIPDGIDNFDHSFFFHLGMDSLFQTKSLTDVTWTKINEAKYTTTLFLDVKEILDGNSPTNLKVNFASHSTNAQLGYSKNIVEQFAQAIKK